MKLTQVQPFPEGYTSNDVDDVARVRESVSRGSPFMQMLLAGTKPEDVTVWIHKHYVHALAGEFVQPRIAAAPQDEKGWTVDRSEFVVVRDEDLQQPHVEGAPPIGQIVAYAKWRFAPSYGTVLGPTAPLDFLTTAEFYPPGYDLDLRRAVMGGIDAVYTKLFKGLPLFILEGISTKSPSHLRQGIAKRMTKWIFPFADSTNLPVVLAATALGYPLYMSCGFEEYRDFDVTEDLIQWGGKGVDIHIIMVRWPRSLTAMPAPWHEWRQKHHHGKDKT